MTSEVQVLLIAPRWVGLRMAFPFLVPLKRDLFPWVPNQLCELQWGSLAAVQGALPQCRDQIALGT